jgi:hypothetical protein
MLRSPRLTYTTDCYPIPGRLIIRTDRRFKNQDRPLFPVVCGSRMGAIKWVAVPTVWCKKSSGGGVSVPYDLVRGELTPAQRKAIHQEVHRGVSKRTRSVRHGSPGGRATDHRSLYARRHHRH